MEHKMINLMQIFPAPTIYSLLSYILFLTPKKYHVTSSFQKLDVAKINGSGFPLKKRLKSQNINMSKHVWLIQVGQRLASIVIINRKPLSCSCNKLYKIGGKKSKGTLST